MIRKIDTLLTLIITVFCKFNDNLGVDFFCVFMSSVSISRYFEINFVRLIPLKVLCCASNANTLWSEKYRTQKIALVSTLKKLKAVEMASSESISVEIVQLNVKAVTTRCQHFVQLPKIPFHNSFS